MLATIGMHSRVVKELVLARADVNIKSRVGQGFKVHEMDPAEVV